jgi:hypothetical protein
MTLVINQVPVELLPGEGVIRCPAVRSLVKHGDLKHEKLETAGVQELVRALSGQERDLEPTEPGSLANVAGFFAILNHGVPNGEVRGRGPLGLFRNLKQQARDVADAAAVAAGHPTTRVFDLELFKSDGDHLGTVNFYKKDEAGEFQVEQFLTIIPQVSDGKVLTIGSLAKLIVMANDGAWDKQGSVVDLAKSAGEWALMVCALRENDQTTDISVADVEQMYSQADPSRLLIGTRRATAVEWVKVTAQISAAVAAEKSDAVLGVATALHSIFEGINARARQKLCPCRPCNPQNWPAAAEH